MKGNFTKKPAPELDNDDEDSVDLEAGGPAIAAVKKNKILIIVASSVLVTVVIYFMFFKGENAGQEKLQEVAPPPVVKVQASEEGKSPFEIEVPEVKKKEDAEILNKPATPEVPTLPDLPEGSIPEEQNIAIPNQQQLPTQPDPAKINQQQLPTQPNPNNIIANQPAPDATADAKKEVNPRYAPIIVFSGAAGGPSLGVSYEKNIVNLNENPMDKLEKSKVAVKTTIVADRVHSITQGKLLTAVLETAINTEIPGAVRAIISRDVYGESGNEVLIPKGSRLFGAYSSKVVRGQGRVDIGWTRLIRPDGVDLAVTFNASDQFGRSGIEGQVDNKYGSIIANSLLTSVLAVGGVVAAEKLIGGSSDTTTTTNTGQGTVSTTGRASSQAVLDVSKTIMNTIGQIVGNTLDMNPVIRVPQGTKITVIVNADMNLPSISKR